MRVLLDECVPRKFRHELVGHVVATVPDAGWSGTKNGALLSLATAEFDAFVTVDQNMRYQQDLRQPSLILVVLVASDNRLETLRPLVPLLLELLATDPAAGIYYLPQTSP